MGFNLFGTVEKDIGQLSGKVGHVVGDTLGWVEQQWTQRIVQISVFSALLFFVLSSFDLINAVDKALTNALGVKVGKDWTRALHAATFGVFMYVGVRFILDNLIKQIINGTVVEGQEENDKGTVTETVTETDTETETEDGDGYGDGDGGGGH